MKGLWYKNATVTITQQVEDEDVLDGEEDRVKTEVIWSGRVYIYPLGARQKLDLSKVQLDVSHRCLGIPQSIDINQGDVISDGTTEYRVQDPQPSFDGPLGTAGWDLLLRSVK